MKMLSFLLLVACLQVGAKGFGQRLTLSHRNAPLEKVLKDIEAQANISFIYSRAAMDQAVPVTISVTNETLENVLTICFTKQPMMYEREEQFIIIKLTTPASTAPTGFFHDIKGRIVNEKNEPIAGATILVKGINKMTQSDNDGVFQLSDIAIDALLIVSAAEFEKQEINVNGRSQLTIRLRQKLNELDETVIVGYGTTTRRFNVGNVSVIKSDVISQQPVANPLLALQGRVAGLAVTSTGGVPGAAVKVQLRGQNTLNPVPGSVNPFDQPLFIIDGVPFAGQNDAINQLSSIISPAPLLYNTPNGGLSPFQLINPQDIESIQVLKDANETAIYGSRGTNGVILINTKAAKPGRTRFSLNTSAGYSRVTQTMPLLTTSQYLALRREAFANDGITPTNTTNSGSASYAPDLMIFDTTRNVDWVDYFLGGTASVFDLNTSVSGGTGATNFMVGAGYHRETYIIPGDFAQQRLTFRSNINHRSSDNRFSLQWSGLFGYDQNNSASSPNIFEAFTLPPNYPELQDQEGNLFWDYKGVSLFNNPVGYLKKPYDSRTNNLHSNLGLSYQLAKGLTASMNAGYSTLLVDEISKLPKSAESPSSNPTSRSIVGNSRHRSWILEPTLNYSTRWQALALSFLVGATYQNNQTRSTQATGTGYINEALLGSISAASTKVITDAFNEYKYVGAYARITSVYQNRYLLHLNARRDGSSRFGPDRQFGNFGSVGAGWIFTEAAWLKNTLPWLSFGKLRASYGSTGSDAVGDYQFMSRWAPSTLVFPGGVVGYLAQNLANPDFGWAITRKLEFALETGFLKDRVAASFAWYRHETDNQLVSYKLPSQNGGFDGITANLPALVENTGWEFSISSKNISTKNLRWTSDINLTIPRNRLVAFPDFEQSSYRFSYVIGEPLSVLNKYRLLGVDPSTGLYTFETKTGPTSTPQRSVDNYRVIGNTAPKLFGGLNNNIEYKRLQLSIFFEFKKQTGPNYLQQLYQRGAAGTYGNLPMAILTRWQTPGDMTEIEKLTSQRNSPAARAATEFTFSEGAFSDASYLRLKTLAISYNWSADWLKKLKLSDARIYLNGQNLVTFTKYQGHDPETMSYFGLPPLRTFMAGIQLTF